ncbi:hypothetical protein [Ketobacter sp.]|uniref:hypothetical protein n=1 Tax=Ketobacter sp. TaxID=2083498 RepID=UPI000F0F63E7|nr:hypothetical protein [Ketobacter sp.]RLT99258.1 MAG: hypothetical protein D9N14_08940 [Ketobacter sp.]
MAGGAKRNGAVWLLLGLLLWGCGNGGGDDGGQEPAPVALPGVLSVSAYYYTDPVANNDLEWLQRFLEARQRIQDAGANGQFQSYPWSQLEPALGSYDSQRLNDFNNTMLSAAEQQFTQLLGLQVINTVTREVPAELATVAWDDPAMIGAMEDLLDQLLPAMAGRVRYLSMGNEVDVYFAAGRLAEVTAYRTFVRAVQDYLSTRLPEIQVGITVTADAWLGPQVQTWLDLTADSDVIITTYYPLHSDFSVRPPDSVQADFPALLSLVTDRPWVLQEVGYPASEVGASSEALQAEFVHQVFAAWRNAEGRIPFLNWFLLHDLSSELVAELVLYYGVDNARFTAYLDSLGLRNRDNTDKAAWSAFVEEAAGWR